ncbi:hypothetical protein ACFQZE_10710 [Paenibacillus sp. GCM10027627]|uniref:hypothetical protein n=1 Tax=unclassified Paenibacillus TaxID=185978 RepID=UPI003631566D
MLSLSVHDSPYPPNEPQHLTIHRIEVFVIPALAIDPSGHRVCLRLSSDLGYGWSEHFVSDSDASLQLDRWGTLLRSFLGRFTLASLSESLAERIAESINPDYRAYKLFAGAVQLFHESGTQKIGAPTDVGFSEEAVLQQRAVAYLSLD